MYDEREEGGGVLNQKLQAVLKKKTLEKRKCLIIIIRGGTNTKCSRMHSKENYTQWDFHSQGEWSGVPVELMWRQVVTPYKQTTQSVSPRVP